MVNHPVLIGAVIVLSAPVVLAAFVLSPIMLIGLVFRYNQQMMARNAWDAENPVPVLVAPDPVAPAPPTQLTSP